MRRILPVLLLGVVASFPVQGQDADFLPPPALEALAIEALEEGEPIGSLALAAALSPDLERLDRATVVVRLYGAETVAITDAQRLTIAFDRSGGELELLPLIAPPDEVSSRCRELVVLLAPPEDYREVAVVAEVGGAWGAAIAEVGELEPDPSCRRGFLDLTPTEEGGEVAIDSPIRILAPGNDVSGVTRIRVLTTTQSARTVEFFLDGELVHRDERPPFSARIDFGPEPRPATLRVVALTSDDAEIGTDEMVVNEGSQPFDIEISDLEIGSDQVRVAARVGVPYDGELARVEFFLGEDLHRRAEVPPFEATVPLPAVLTGAEFIRVVATLEDGRWLEDVALLQGGRLGEEIEVNLVELYVVATDRRGDPVLGLEQGDFEVSGPRGLDIRVERFELATDIPLALGLVIDTSESMYTIMDETKRAAGIFLGDMITERDRGFIVHFDDRPRLAAPLTGDLTTLFRGLAGLHASGYTAMYDAVAYSCLQFDELTRRRALVLLTDGADSRSRLNLPQAVREARAAGLPVYIIALGGLDGLRRDIRTMDLETITSRTGGRVFTVHALDEVRDAYSSIASELRSQYVISFSTDAPLSDDELKKIDVDVARPGVRARVAINPLQ